jgi:pseudaminic acid synthase
MKKRPFLVAEISANHCGSLNLAKKLIKCAKKNGADAVKLQTYTPETMTINSSNKKFIIKSGLWKGYKLWDLYKEAHTPLHWHKELFKFAKKNKIKIFSTPFDETAVDFLEKLNCPIYKIASFELTDLPLIKKIASLKKPIILSTGMANLKEIETSFNIALKFNKLENITLLYCVSNYPSKLKDFNLHNIDILKKKFNFRIGLSDHSKDYRIASSAVIAGAEVFEKHIALDNQKKGHDINFSLKGKELRIYREEINLSYRLLGKEKFVRNKSEDKSKIFRRSIYVSKFINKGERFNINNIVRRRPNIGLEPKYFDYLLNKKSPKKYKPGDSISKKIFKLI